jgi:hypothetical protein
MKLIEMHGSVPITQAQQYVKELHVPHLGTYIYISTNVYEVVDPIRAVQFGALLTGSALHP